MAKKKVENLSFEESLSELENIVTALEQGDLNLEDAMTQFERGLSLSKHSQDKLATAEQKVKSLMSLDEDAPLQDFDNSEIA
jgi:exodeoxyribonuclease VII small subunit